MGFRPYTIHLYGDTWLYAYSYEHLYTSYNDLRMETEWLWEWFAYQCYAFGLSTSMYFFVIELLYIGAMFMCCWRLMRNNVWVAFLFCVSSFSFLSYGVNGIRNGLACSFILLAISFLQEKYLGKALALLLIVVAFFMHNSTLLPSICLIVSIFAVKKPSLAISFWGASIFISLILGNAVGDFFAGLGFDERSSYFEDAATSKNAELFSSTGFRFDFLLYSAMPILMTWYITIKRNFHDKTYNLIANTYILANAFWIMVIRASYSNRFAYLSWFIYPLVIAYPLVRMNLWKDQDKKSALILLAYAGFTILMFFR